MKEKLEKLKDRFVQAKTQAEREAIDKEMKTLFSEDENLFAVSMCEMAKETADKAEELVLRNKIQDILPLISLSYMAKTYFNKSRQWFYQRLNGNEVNGKRAQFTQEELKILDFALQDISKKIGSVRVA